MGKLNFQTTHRGRHFTMGQKKTLNILTSTTATALENIRLYTQLQEADQKYKSIFENANEAIFVVQDGKIVFANPKSFELSGYSLEEFTSRLFIDFIHPDDRAVVIETYLKRIQGEEVPPGYSYRILDKAGNTKWVEPNVISIHWEGKPAALTFMSDISIRKQAEARQRLFFKILDLLNQVREKGDLIRKILYLLKEETGIEAIGIRLREGGDFPYYETSGFSETFTEKERYLCARDEKGEIIRDSQGNPYLECLCGNVLCMRTDSSLSFFTEGGSFWTNSASELLNSTSKKDFQSPLRNCFKNESYESIALIPLKSGDEVIGLLQMNDRKPSQFSLDIIKFLEGIGASIGIALARKQMEEALFKEISISESTIDSLPGLFYLLDEQKRFLRWNKNLELISGYSAEEISHMHPRDFFTGENKESIENKIQEAFEKGEVGIEAEFVSKDGHKTIYFFTGRGLDLDHTPHLVGVGIDISERKRVEDYLKQSLERLRKALGATVNAISSMVETRDPYTAGHQRRVADLARAIATEMGLPNDQIDGIRMAAIIHDIGKISVPAEILSMPRKLTDIEFSLIKTHAQSGHDILRDIDFTSPVAQIVLQHHERMDGSGYPNELTGTEILLEARILAVADVVEAIASHRPYRPAFGIEEALEEIEKNKGTLYDNAVADACLRLFREKGFQLEGA